MNYIRAIFIYSIFLAANAYTADLPPSVREALRNAKIPLQDVGILVQEVNAPAPLLEVNAKQAMNPASTMKLLTTYAALELLGPAYSWRTEAYVDGKLVDGVLDGNLIIKGYGNPKMTAENLWLWLHDMRSRGLREIHGKLILDRSAFAAQDYDTGAFDNDPDRAYNVAPDALLLNFNAIRLRFIPEEERVNIFTEPSLAGIKLENRLALVKQRYCGAWDGNINISLTPSGKTIRVQGTYPAICGEHEKAVSLLTHTQYFDAVFRYLWQEMGGTISGNTQDGKIDASAELFATQYSQPLSEIIRDINKYSNNVMARQVFLSLSLKRDASINNIPEKYNEDSPANAESLPPPASLALSEAALRNWLAGKGYDFPELVIDNGAGLSRNARISADSMSLILKDILLSPFSAEVVASLPIVGVDGTMRKRHDNCIVTTHAHLKTGSLEGVKSIAGYLQSQSGKKWIIVFIINHQNASRGQQAQDELIEWLAKNY
jgi:D-alanyl-D-alanine carboxypeptidase/D-alanyl-D-alanine-endopeptidase (penicillin-binding protein 4)